MFDFFGFRKTRNKLAELEHVITKQQQDIKTLERVIDRLREALEKEMTKHEKQIPTAAMSVKNKKHTKTLASTPVVATDTSPTVTSSSSNSDMMTGFMLGSILHHTNHSSSADTYSNSSSSSYDSSSSSDSGSSSSSSD